MRVSEPRKGEPIRIVQTKGGPRYRVVLDVGERPDGRRRQVTGTRGTLKEARTLVTDTRADVARGTYTAPAALSFDGLCARWLDSRRDVREITRRGYATVLKPVRGRLGQRKAQEIRRADLEALVSWLGSEGGQRGKGLSQRSIVFTLGVKAPRKQRGDGREAQLWEAADLLRFRAVADADEWAVGWRLTMCGLRRSEVLGLSWEAVDMLAGVVTVKAGRVALDGHRTATDDPKSAASWRQVPVEAMHAGTSSLLRSLRARQAAERLAAGSAYSDSGYVLVDALGRPIRPEAYSDRFTALCRQAEVPSGRLHDVRHTLALMMHRAGQAPADAASLLGHSVAVHLTTQVPRTERGAQTAAAALGHVLAAAR